MVARGIGQTAVLLVWIPVLCGVLAAGCPGTASQPASSASYVEVEVTEWTVPWAHTRPRDPFVDRQGNVWFVGQRGDYIAALDPDPGTFARHDLVPGTGPHNLIVDEQGAVWYAGNRGAHIGRLTPGSGEITRYAMPDPAAGDPHTLVRDGAGRIWFTVQQGNFVGQLEAARGKVRLVPLPTPAARPYGIVLDPKGRPWLTEFGANKLATVDPSSLALTEVALPRDEARPRRLAATSDGAIWYVDYAEGYLGRLDPTTNHITEWRAPGEDGAYPYGMAADDRDRLWFVETGPDPNRLVGFDPRTETFFSLTEIPSGGGTIRHMVFHGPTRTMWFGTDANTIGRARVP